MNRPTASAWRRMAGLQGFVEGPSTFAEDDPARAYWIGGKQVVNLRGPDRIELRVTKAIIARRRQALRSDPRVELRRNPSDWLIVHLTKLVDADLVVELATLAAEAHRHLNTLGNPPVPEGADLARRRRFH